ncbi:thioredoxin family protein [Patescibacteria group bacterium]|nr:thioredoxin family protein [Patescibacteria group bacterium]
MPVVKIFSTPTCVYCETLKEYLKKHSINFKDIDVSKDEAALNEMIEKSSQMGVPVVAIDSEIIVGFDKNKINQLLKIKE